MTAASPSTSHHGNEPPHVPHPVLRLVLVVGGVIVVYYAVPIGRVSSEAALALSVVGLVVGMWVLVWLLVGQVRWHLQAGADSSVRLQSLVVLAVVVVPMFALGYFGLARADSGQFVGLETKTDALYFTMSMVATVGFGDVAAAGQLARALVTAQIAFDLVFLAVVGSVFSSRLRERPGARRPGT